MTDGMEDMVETNFVVLISNINIIGDNSIITVCGRLLAIARLFNISHPNMITAPAIQPPRDPVRRSDSRNIPPRIAYSTL